MLGYYNRAGCTYSLTTHLLTNSNENDTKLQTGGKLRRLGLTLKLTMKVPHQE